MKKLIIVTISIFIFNFCFAYEWSPMGPSGIKANKICIINSYDFDVFAIIVVDTGIYIVPDLGTITTDFFDLPIVDACPFEYNASSDSIIVLINEGSYSDGIYSFHLGTHELSLIEFCYKPNFVEYWPSYDKFFVGYEGGLLTSDDGLSWEPDLSLDQMNCTSITQYTNNVEYIILITDNPTDNAFVLEGQGQIWIQIFADFQIKQAFNEYGICSNEDDEYGGVYKLYFPGLIYEWEKQFNSAYMNCIGGSNTGHAFVGWHSSEGNDEGVAQVLSSSFQFKNEGLPCLDINHITSDPGIVGGEIVFCCTDEGVVWLSDVTPGVNTNKSNQEISIYPNPAVSSGLINISLANKLEYLQIQLFSIKGKLEFETKIENNFSNQNIQIQLPDISAGVYYCHIKSDKGNIVKKMIVR